MLWYTTTSGAATTDQNRGKIDLYTKNTSDIWQMASSSFCSIRLKGIQWIHCHTNRSVNYFPSNSTGSWYIKYCSQFSKQQFSYLSYCDQSTFCCPFRNTCLSCMRETNSFVEKLLVLVSKLFV